MRVTRAAATVSQKIDIYYTFIGEVGATQLVAQLELKGKAA